MMKVINPAGCGFAAWLAVVVAGVTAGCASQQQAQTESRGDAAPVASPARQEVREGFAEMVLTSRPWPTFAEASVNRITSVAGGSPVFVHIRSARSLGELALPADPQGRYAFSAYPILYLHVGDTESLVSFSTCYLTLTPQEAASQELVVSLLPPGDRPGGVPADCLLSAPAAAGTGRRTFELRLAGFAGQYDSWLPKADLLSVASVPSNYSRSVAASAATARVAPGSSSWPARDAAAVATDRPSPSSAPVLKPAADAPRPAPNPIVAERRIEPGRGLEPERRVEASRRSEPWNLIEPDHRPAPESRIEPERRSGSQGNSQLAARTAPAMRSTTPSDEVKAPAAGTLPSPPRSPARIVIHHYTADAAAAARALALQARLTSQPEVEVEIRPVTAPVSADNIRVFFEADRVKAHSAMERLRSGPIPIRDFSDYRPLPRPGTIELWLAAPDSASGSAAAAVPQPPSTSAAASSPAPAPASSPASAPASSPASGQASASAATSASTSRETGAFGSRSASVSPSNQPEVSRSPSAQVPRSDAETLRLLLLKPTDPKSGTQ
jgi:hypothetical protein